MYADGDKYVGHWWQGKKSGAGELYYVNGDKFRYFRSFLCTCYDNDVNTVCH